MNEVTMKKRPKLRTLICMMIILTMIIVVPIGTAESSFAAKKKTAAPKLKTLQYYQNANGSYSATLTWYSKKGYTYQILRKAPGGKYKVIAKKKAKGKTTKYVNKKIGANKTYIYSVRQYKAKRKKKISKYDPYGLQLMKRPTVSVDFQNLKAVISWSAVEQADGYCVYRKVGSDGTYQKIATLGSSARSYTEVYRSAKGISSNKINAGHFIDPSYNSLHYTVRPYHVSTYKNIKKTSWGLYSRDGEFHLEPPVIVNLTKSSIKWGNVPNAKSYRILKKSSPNGSWSSVKTVTRKSGTTMSASMSINSNSYYAVQAVSSKNGKKVYSKVEPGATLKYAGSEQKILYFGDSITYGSPYKGNTTRHIFSYPNRVHLLTGAKFYNPSIPGSTYHYAKPDTDETGGRYRMVTGVVGKIRDGNNPDNYVKLDTANKKSVNGIKDGSTISDYDVVIMAAGTNDYLDNTPLGAEDSDDISTFNGSFNTIMSDISAASQKRLENGMPGIQVVFVDLFYSDRTYPSNYGERNNRDVTPNKIGLTLQDYQKELNKAYEKWSAEPSLRLFHFETRKYGIVDNSNCPYMASDNLHFTKYAYAQYGNALADFLSQVVFPGERALPDDFVTTEPEETTVVDVDNSPATNEAEPPAVEEGNTPVTEGEDDPVEEEGNTPVVEEATP